MKCQWDYVCILANGVEFDEWHRTLSNIDDADKKTILGWVDDHKANVQKLLGTHDPHSVKAHPGEPTYNLSFHVTFSDGSPGAALALTDVPYTVMHACEWSAVDLCAAMVKEGKKYAQKHGWKTHDAANEKHLKHIAVK